MFELAHDTLRAENKRSTRLSLKAVNLERVGQ